MPGPRYISTGNGDGDMDDDMGARLSIPISFTGEAQHDASGGQGGGKGPKGKL